MLSKHRASFVYKACIEALEQRRLLTTFYVDNGLNHGGSDSNSGTSLSAPFYTIQKAASVAQPGDVVDICAGTYRETVIPQNSGTAAAPITYQPYNNEKVIVSGADIVSGWTPYSGNIYQSSAQTWTMGGQDDQVFVDGQMINYARWPNTSLDVSHPNWESAGPNTVGHQNSNGTLTETVYDANLTQPAGYWNGATIHIESGATWVYETATITSFTRAVVNGVSYGVITYTSAFTDPNYNLVTQGDPYYITGKFQTLDSAGEFYRDPTTGTLYLWTPSGDSPASHVIEAKHREWAFDLSWVSYINVQGISIFAAGINSNSYSNHLTISNINAQYVSHFETYTGNWFPLLSDGTAVNGNTGIILKGDYETLQNSTIAYSAGDGVFLGGNHETVDNNVIHDCDYAGVIDACIDTAQFGTGVSANDDIGFNTVFNSGRAVISVSGLSASRVHNNQVWNPMLQTADGGAIYGYYGNGNGTEIDHNVVFNAYNSVAGFGVNGIFLDSSSNGYTIDHNLIYNVAMGISCFDTNTNNILNNTVFATSVGLNFYGTPSGNVANNIAIPSISNITWGSNFNLSNNLLPPTDPLVVSTQTGNYQLQSTSPAINAGIVFAPYTNGYLGSAPDLGAFEYGATAWTAGAGNTTAALAAIALPSGWTSADIGSPSIAGNSTYSNGVYTVSGSGSDIWNASDQFQFAYTSVTGDQTIIARVASQINVNVWSKAGLMFRSSTAANSAFVGLTQTSSSGLLFYSRDASGNLAHVSGITVQTPVWLKLVRSGNLFTGFESPDGVNWQQVSSITLTLPTSTLAGLAVTSHDVTGISTATFDNVSVAAVPTSPTGLAISSATTNSMNLTWTAAPAATGYQVQRSTDGVNFSTVATLGAVTTYADSTGLSAGTKYYYRIIATNGTVSSAASSISNASTLTVAPSGLTAAGTTSTQTTLSWAATTGAVSYNIYRGATSGGEGSTPIATGITGLTFTNTGLTSNTPYYYRITAVNANAAPLNSESAQSSEVSVTTSVVNTLPGTPTGISATAGVGSVALSWTAATNDVTYNLYRGTTAGGEGTTPWVTGLTTTSYTDTTAIPGKQYYYTVTGVNGSKESSASGEVSATPLAIALLDGSFEKTSVNGSYAYAPTTANWKFTGNAGIEANGSAWGAANAPDGTQAAFLQSLSPTAGGTIAQTLSVAAAGTYQFTFFAAQRAGKGVEPITVSVDGNIVTSITPGSTSFQSYSTSGITLPAGSYVLSFATAATTSVDSATFIDDVSVAAVQATNLPAIPGIIQAENYDAGGQGLGYNVPNPYNTGGPYRTDGVDLEPNADNGGGYDIGWVRAGEWFNYTVNVTTTGNYLLSMRVASAVSGGTLHLESNGTNLTGTVSTPNTGGWENWTTITQTIALTAGPQTLKLSFDSAPNNWVCNFNWFQLTTIAPVVSTPYSGTPIALPAIVQAENYDLGGEGVAYHDTDSVNQGGAYRNDGVDIENTGDTGGGYDVGYVQAGEWLKYTISVPTVGLYTFSPRVATPASGATMHIEIDGVNVTGSLTVPNTGAWQTYASITSPAVQLTAGTHVMRIVFDTDASNGFGPNTNYVNVSALETVTNLSGTVLGTPGSNGNTGNTIAKAVDGDLTTYFNAPDTNLTDWVGLDLGSARTITQIEYAPRVGYEYRMVGGVFQVSTTPDFSSNVITIGTITTAPTAGVLTTLAVNPGGAFRYVRYTGGTERVTIAELEIDGF